MRNIFLKVLSLFSFICICIFSLFFLTRMFNVNILESAHDNNIYITMATDNNYTYPTIVAITSILKNKNPETKINFYVMLSGDFDQSSKDKIDSLKQKYDGCSIYFVDMRNADDKLKKLYTSKHITTASYYRLLLPDLLQNLDKVLYMDVDTITQHDLSNLFNINIDDYYFAGVTDMDVCCVCGPLKVKDKKIKDMFVETFGDEKNLESTYVNAGILLFNLRKMREDKLTEKLIKFASLYNLPQHDQDALNYVCHDKIKTIDKIFNCMPGQINNLENQIIIHYASEKPWNNQNLKYANIWWNYAKETGLEKEIKEKFHGKIEKAA